MAILLLVLAAVIALVSSEAGSRWLQQQSILLVPGKLTIAAMSGSLLGPFTLRGLHYQHATVEIELEQLTFDWQPWRLLNAELVIDSLSIDSLQVTVPPLPASVPATSLQLHSVVLPLTLKVAQASCRYCRLITADKSTVAFDNIALRAGADHHGITIEALQLRSAVSDLALSGTLQPVGDYPLALTMSGWWQPDTLARLTGRLEVAGDLRQLTFKQQLTAPLLLDATGTLNDLLTTPRVQMQIGLSQFDASQLNATWPKTKGALQATVRGGLTAVDISGKANFVYPNLSDFQTQFELGWQPQSLAIRRLMVEQPAIANQAEAKGEIDLTTLRSDLDVRWQRFSWPLNRSAQFSVKDGRMRLNGRLDDYRGTATGVINTPMSGDVPTQLQAAGSTTGITLHNVLLNLWQGVVRADARLDWRERFNSDIKLDWRDVVWPPAIDRTSGRQELLTSTGGGVVTGELDNYRFNLASDLHGPKLPLGKWRIAGQGDQHAIRVQQLQGAWLAGEVTAQGQLAWSPHLAWQGNITTKGVNPAAYWPTRSGQLDANITTAGEMTADGIAGRWEVKSLRGTLNKLPITLQGSVAVAQGDAWNFDQLQLAWGDARVAAAGHWGKTVALTWQLTAPALKQLDARVAGALHSTGKISGVRASPHLSATVEGQGLRWGNYKIGKLQSDLDVTVASWQKVDISLELEKISVNGYGIDNVKFTNRGSGEQHESLLTASNNHEQLRLATVGQWRDATWTLDFISASFNATKWGEWQLQSAQPLTVVRDNITVGEHCWQERALGAFCIDAQRDNTGWQSNLRLKELSLHLLSPLLQKGTDTVLAGATDGTLQLRYDTQQRLQGKLDLAVANGVMTLQNNERGHDVLIFHEASLRGQLDEHGVTAQFSMQMGERDHARFAVTLPDFDPLQPPAQQQTMAGAVDVMIADLGLFEAMFPDVGRAKGVLALNFDLGGTLAQPTFNGMAQVSEGSLAIPRAGVEIKEIALLLRSSGDSRITMSGEARSGGGRVHLTGNSAPDEAGHWQTQLTVQGSDFELINIPEAHLFASPDLEAQWQGNAIVVNGVVTIPRAKLQPKDLSSAVKVSEDVVIVGESLEPTASEQWRITSTVRVVLGERVSFYGFGFEGRFKGNVVLQDQPGEVTVATGLVEIPEGRYRAYGQRLQVDNGRILFAGGPITNPGLDIRAVRKIQAVTAGVKVRGTLQKPQLELFSEPAMGESDALAYLVIGRPLEGGNTTGKENDALASAAVALGLSGGDTLARQLGDRLGLDEIRVESGESGDAALVIGRYLTPKLYINYGVGLIDALDSFNIRYQLTRRWQLLAEKSGLQEGGDLIYTFDRKKSAAKK